MNSAYIFRVKIPIIGPVRLYSKIMRKVNCKSEGNVLGIENEEKGDAHFCK
ncbi:hypothetical protein SUBVAR_07160 [Subdoligranulum variabile DSM 15176]|uniref:Uncharacterized protein n=1 Tax=Subdoligranulum variabile DSM 15176 TaxID=411471 RepID=D1PRX7_9FIRM|nr:hypothetical protein SUBVAR_07160 [Subdoligranulum variabile DSM 15176]